ncbi:olfactory receptor 52K2-like [Aplochiton taeniatus]
MEKALVRNASYTHFILDGFSDLGELRPLLFIPYLCIFILAVAANAFLIYIIISTKSLHSPMCILIALMALVDLCLPVLFVPNMLVSLAFNLRGISLEGCLVQMFCIHFMSSFQSTLLSWMALDRYFAICTPLFYHKRMTFHSFLSFAIPALIRNVVMNTAVVSLAGKHTFCFNRMNNCFCEHMALMQLSCGDISINNLVGLIGVFITPVADFLLTSASYVVIFVSIFSKAGKPNMKAINTSVTHIIVMIVCLSFTLMALLSYRIANSISPNYRVLLSTLYLLVPSCFNPIIYGIRTKGIRVQSLKCLGFAPSE